MRRSTAGSSASTRRYRYSTRAVARAAMAKEAKELTPNELNSILVGHTFEMQGSRSHADCTVKFLGLNISVGKVGVERVAAEHGHAACVREARRSKRIAKRHCPGRARVEDTRPGCSGRHAARVKRGN